MGNNFEDKYKVNLEKENKNNQGKALTAKKGTAKKYKINKKRLTASILVTVMTLMAAGKVAGTFIDNRSIEENEVHSIEQMEQLGISTQNLGMSQETIDELTQYEEYFNNLSEEELYSLTEEKIMNMIQEIRQLHFSVVKEKMATITQTKAFNVELSSAYEKNDGRHTVMITTQDDNYNREQYTNVDKLIGENKNYIPEELANAVIQIGELDYLQTSLQNDKISKVNAVKDLKEDYEALLTLATGELIKDERGNIAVVHYDKSNDKQPTEKEQEQEER